MNSPAKSPVAWAPLREASSVGTGASSALCGDQSAYEPRAGPRDSAERLLPPDRSLGTVLRAHRPRASAAERSHEAGG